MAVGVVATFIAKERCETFHIFVYPLVLWRYCKQLFSPQYYKLRLWQFSSFSLLVVPVIPIGKIFKWGIGRKRNEAPFIALSANRDFGRNRFYSGTDGSLHFEQMQAACTSKVLTFCQKQSSGLRDGQLHRALSKELPAQVFYTIQVTKLHTKI